MVEKMFRSVTWSKSIIRTLLNSFKLLVSMPPKNNHQKISQKHPTEIEKTECGIRPASGIKSSCLATELESQI